MKNYKLLGKYKESVFSHDVCFRGFFKMSIKNNFVAFALISQSKHILSLPLG